MLHLYFHFICIFIFTICFAPINSGRHECEFPSDLQDLGIPPYDPSQYLADTDSANYTSSNIHFVFLSNVSEEMNEALDRITGWVNQRLSSIIKTPGLSEIRRKRIWIDALQKCNPPICGWPETIVPVEYALPCQCPVTNATVADDPPVPCEPTDQVNALNEGKNITLVVYVEAEQSNPRHVRHCTETGAIAYSRTCQVDSSGRPTHGYIGICVDAHELIGEKAERTGLHEILHILTWNNVAGLGSPHLNCPYIGNRVLSLVQCENITYKVVQQPWQRPDGTFTVRTRVLLITPNVVQAAQQHYGCEHLEGAEITSREVTETESLNLHGEVLPGTLIPTAHWSQIAFPDEILIPSDDGHSRLSALILGLLKDLGWYEVDMDAAEPMEGTKPDPWEGCVIAHHSYYEIIDVRRTMQRMTHTHNRERVSSTMGPYCDNDFTRPDRVITPRCLNDREPLHCYEETIAEVEIAILCRPPYYDSFACDQTGLRLNYHPDIGATVGPDTICLTVGPYETERAWMEDTGICVERQCQYDERAVKLIWKPFQHPCTIICPEDASLKRKMIRMTDEQCRENVSEFLPVICPDYSVVCPPPTQSMEQTVQPAVVRTEGALFQADGSPVSISTDSPLIQTDGPLYHTPENTALPTDQPLHPGIVHTDRPPVHTTKNKVSINQPLQPGIIHTDRPLIHDTGSKASIMEKEAFGVVLIGTVVITLASACCYAVSVVIVETYFGHSSILGGLDATNAPTYR